MRRHRNSKLIKARALLMKNNPGGRRGAPARYDRKDDVRIGLAMDKRARKGQLRLIGTFHSYSRRS